jgi:hypothetical protein
VNPGWTITKDGDLVADEGAASEYLIDRARLLETTDRAGETTYDWPVHMAEKTWVNVEIFLDAFERALKQNGMAYDDEMMRRTIRAARKIGHQR